MDKDEILEWKKQLESDINVGFDFEFEVVEKSAQSPEEEGTFHNVILRYGEVVITDDVVDIVGSCNAYVDTYKELVHMLEHYIKEVGTL